MQYCGGRHAEIYARLGAICGGAVAKYWNSPGVCPSNPYPATTAANAAWQLRGDPVFHAGAFYYPTGPTVFFDGNVMARTGTYEGVPLYEDATLSPFTIVYVPIGGNVVRPYERRREGELAGTVGSRPPSFPISATGEVPVQVGVPVITASFAPEAGGFVPVIPQTRPIGTLETVCPRNPQGQPLSLAPAYGMHEIGYLP